MQQDVRGDCSARPVLFQNLFFDQILNVPQGRVVRRLRQFGPLPRPQFSCEPVEQQIANVFLSVVDLTGFFFPRTRLFPERRRSTSLLWRSRPLDNQETIPAVS